MPDNQWNEPDEHPIVGQWHVRHRIPAARDTGYMFGKNFATLEAALAFCEKTGDGCRLLSYAGNDMWLKIEDVSKFYYVPGSET